MGESGSTCQQLCTVCVCVHGFAKEYAISRRITVKEPKYHYHCDIRMHDCNYLRSR